MKISNKEKYLLGGLVSVLILAGYYQLVYTKQSEKLSALSSEKSQVESKYKAIKKTINELDMRKEQLVSLNTTIYDKAVMLYPAVIQEKTIIEIDEMLRKANVRANLLFDSINVKPIDGFIKSANKLEESALKPYVDEYEGNTSESTDESNSSKESSGLNVEQMKVTLSYIGTYEQLTAFIKKIEEHNKKIVVSNISITSEEKGSALTGKIVLYFFSVPKVDDEDDEYFKYTINGVIGKGNPFDGSSTASKLVVNTNIYDFILITKPSKSDLSTLSMKYAKSNGLDTAIYDDGEDVKDLEVVFYKENGKYFYKYKTNRESYPKNYASEKVEFTPLGDDIVISAISTIRIDENDKSGVRLKVINNTDKIVDVNIKGDDESRPRVTVISEGKSVNVTKTK